MTTDTPPRRATKQKAAIARAFEEAGRPLSPAELCDAARAHVPSVNLATVYRFVKEAVDRGEIRVVEMPGAAARYEPSGLGHHHHFWCNDCDRVFDVKGCPPGITDLVPDGFELEEHGIVLYGRCKGCADGGES